MIRDSHWDGPKASPATDDWAVREAARHADHAVAWSAYQADMASWKDAWEAHRAAYGVLPGRPAGAEVKASFTLPIPQRPLG